MEIQYVDVLTSVDPSLIWYIKITLMVYSSLIWVHPVYVLIKQRPVGLMVWDWCTHCADLRLGGNAEFFGQTYRETKLQTYTVNVALGDLVWESCCRGTDKSRKPACTISTCSRKEDRWMIKNWWVLSSVLLVQRTTQNNEYTVGLWKNESAISHIDTTHKISQFTPSTCYSFHNSGHGLNELLPLAGPRSEEVWNKNRLVGNTAAEGDIRRINPSRSKGPYLKWLCLTEESDVV